MFGADVRRKVLVLKRILLSHCRNPRLGAERTYRKIKHREMKPPPFSYHDPKTVAEVVGLLSTLENAKLLAGGQSLMPMLNFRYVQPDHIIDLNRVEGLSYIRETPDGMDVERI